MATYNETMSGGLIVGGTAIKDFSLDKIFTWNTGDIPLRWWRIEGCCSNITPSTGSGNSQINGGCDILNIQIDANCNSSQSFVQNILAVSLAEVCEKLQESGLKWKICSIKSFGKLPYNSTPDECNALVEVPFDEIPECLIFTLHTDAIVNIVAESESLLDINFYEGSGGIEFTGSAETSSSGTVFNDFVYNGGGDIIFGGEATTSSSWQTLFVTEIIADASVEREEAIFDTSTNVLPLELPSQFVSTNCGLCTSVPTVLYAYHNLQNGGMLAEFLQRNGVELANPLTMHYSNRFQSWTANSHLLGEDNESWRFVFSWSCASEFSTTSSFWNFSLLVVKKDLITNLDFDTRILCTFNASNICSGAQNLGFDFSFSLNTKTHYVYNDFNVVSSSVVLYDNIGLFKSSSWNKNPLLQINISKNNAVLSPERKDIYSIFPTRKVILA